LTYLFWELAVHGEWQERLHTELSSQPEWQDGIPRQQEVSDLPVLSAVINEALRLHPAAPASLQRETPAGGRVLNGFKIPPGVRPRQMCLICLTLTEGQTVVSAQCYTTQRDPDVFRNPDIFLPERWLDTREQTSESKTLFMPFSLGPRACLGKNLAMLELKLITATFVRSFSVRAASTTTVESMSMKDHFLVLPKGGTCDLIFERRL
jgi:cytochrome P450